MGYTENLIDFIGKSTDCYHAVKTAKDRLDETQSWAFTLSL